MSWIPKRPGLKLLLQGVVTPTGLYTFRIYAFSQPQAPGNGNRVSIGGLNTFSECDHRQQTASSVESKRPHAPKQLGLGQMVIIICGEIIYPSPCQISLGVDHFGGGAHLGLVTFLAHSQVFFTLLDGLL